MKHRYFQHYYTIWKNNSIHFLIKKIFHRTIGKHLQDIQQQIDVETAIGMVTALDITPEQWESNRQLTMNQGKVNQSSVKTINWFIPRFEHVLYGGIYTIFRFAAYFQAHGIHNRIVIYDHPSINIELLQASVVMYFPELQNAEFIALTGDVNELPACDASICTFWTSAFVQLKFQRTKKKFYFIQDYEPLFYSASTYYGLAEATYRFGFEGIVNTPGLAQYIEKQHQMKVSYFMPCVNQSLFTISDKELENKLNKSTPVKIIMYGRPHHDRNGFNLALTVARQLKERYGDRVEIRSIGDEWDEQTYNVAGIIENLGRCNDMNELANIYRVSDIGLVFMFTKHPSYQPFEYMATGCAVVTNYNEANLWLLQHEKTALLSEPIPAMIVEQLRRLIDDPQLRQNIVLGGLRVIQKSNWDAECEKIITKL